MAAEIAAPKLDLRAKAKKGRFWSTFPKKRKSPAPSLIKSTDKSLSQPWCSHSNTSQLQKTIVFPPQHNSHATFMQPLQCVLQHHAHIHAAITMRFASTRCRTPRRNRLRTRRAHKLPFIASCSHFTRKNLMFRAPASSPTQVPCNIPAAITMCFEAPCTHPCSHYNALCIHALQGGTD